MNVQCMRSLSSSFVNGFVSIMHAVEVPSAPKILHGHMLTAMAGKEFVIPAGSGVLRIGLVADLGACSGAGNTTASALANVNATAQGHGDFAVTVEEPGLYSVCVCAQAGS